MEDPLDRALGLAYRSLARRDRTEVEVRRHLEARDVEPGIVDEALTVLAEQGYVDDARYARRFVEDRRRLDAWGSERIERQLLAVGVAPEYVEASLAGQEVGWEIEAAVALLRRRFPQPPGDDRARSRALGVLVRRGYDLELAHDALRAHERGAG
ncbi:MAG: regulatory protein RecX [Solirubrobacteraceae bacterium]